MPKKLRLSSTIQPEDLCDLGVDILSDTNDDDDSDTTSIYNDYDRKIAEDFEETKKARPLPAEDFTYRRKSAEDRLLKVNLFEDLPDELIMGILRYLDKKSLVALALTCHRFDRLCHDEGLWPRLNLASRKLETDNIGHILIVGVKVLRLYSAIFPSPMVSPAMSLKLDNFVAKVKCLDLSYAWIAVDDLTMLLSKMRHLTKLSLEGVNVNVDVVKAVVVNKHLDTLNMSMATGLTHCGLSLLVKNLLKLESLNVAWTRLEPCAFAALANDLTPNIKHLDISGSHLALKNDDLVSLVKRCSFLESLDVSDCITVSTNTLREIVKLPALKFLGISRCYQLDLRALGELKNAPKLEVLAAYKLIPDSKLIDVRALLPAVRVNKNPLSVIARPTVGIRRTSIWELPTSD